MFEAIILSHPWLHGGDIEKEVISDPEIAIAILSFFKAKALSGHHSLFALLDLTPADIPDLGRHWWQKLIEALLFSATWQHEGAQSAFVEQLKKQLRAAELLRRNELSLERSRIVERTLSLSLAKVAACSAIHRLEYKHRGQQLRQVILADYIRDEELTSAVKTGEESLGAWPIFKAVTAASPIQNEIALLTGRLSIIPTAKLQQLMAYLDHDKINVEPMCNQQQFHKVSGPLHLLTQAFTALLMAGEIKVLIGTRSLLGEGWDAPVVNALILASSVGSFMLTNQMRGRAIRSNPNDRNKTSSIWHLTAINAKSYSGWSDFSSLNKRFNTFVGLSEKATTIESGFERMNAMTIQYSFNFSPRIPIIGNNRQMVRRYKAIHHLGKRWEEALTLDDTARVIPSVKSIKTPVLRGYLLKHAFGYLLTQLMAAIAASVFIMFHSYYPRSLNELGIVMASVIGAVLLYKLPTTYSIIKTAWCLLPVDGALKQIGKALTEALCRAGLIKTQFCQLKVNINKNEEGSFYISLSGGTFYEASLFADCVAEILSPIDSPRYLILRKGLFFGMQRDDYHAVPMKFAVRKETALLFYQSWHRHVCLSELIYTRTAKGRKRLLKAKMRAFSSIFRDEVRRVDQWRNS